MSTFIFPFLLMKVKTRCLGTGAVRSLVELTWERQPVELKTLWLHWVVKGVKITGGGGVGGFWPWGKGRAMWHSWSDPKNRPERLAGWRRVDQVFSIARWGFRWRLERKCSIQPSEEAAEVSKGEGPWSRVIQGCKVIHAGKCHQGKRWDRRWS